MKGNYWRSLFFTYVSYTLAMILSSGGTDILTERLLVDHRIAWLLMLLSTGVLNYHLLQKTSFAD